MELCLLRIVFVKFVSFVIRAFWNTTEHSIYSEISEITHQ